MSKPRLLTFDILRILAIAAIVTTHINHTGELVLPYIFGDFGIWGMGWSIATFGVSVIIFVSGAVLEYNHGANVSAVTSAIDYGKFMLKRAVRLYPLYLLSLPVAWISMPYAQMYFWSNPLLEITGFRVVMGQFDSDLNTMAWFIGMIVSLYFLYPFLTKFIENYGVCAIGTIFIISHTFVTIMPYSGYYSPLARMFEFALGIYIVKIGLYPKAETTNNVVKFLSDITYPVFIVHTLFFNWFYPYGLPQYLVITMAMSLWFWYIDGEIQTVIKLYLN